MDLKEENDDRMEAEEEVFTVPLRPNEHPSIPARLPRNQADIDLALQLIDDYQSTLSELDKTIGAAEKVLAEEKDVAVTEHQKKINDCKEGYDRKIHALEEEHRLRMSSLEEKSKSDTRDVRSQREAIDKKLKEQQGFLAPIRKLPSELMVEVFKWYIDNQVPNRILPLVCHEWRNWILITPSLWRNIEVRFLDDEYVARYLDQLQRRIDLSGSVFLDITLDTTHYAELRCREPFVRVSKISMERWQSLTMRRGGYLAQDVFNGLFIGNLSNLRSLRCNSFYGQTDDDGFLPLYESIKRSRPPLQIAAFGGELPETLKVSEIFQPVQSLSAPGRTIVKMHPLPNLLSLHVSHMESYDKDQDSHLFPILPKHTAFGFIRKSQLGSLNLSNVQTLELSMHTEEGAEDHTMYFSNLESLTFTRGSLQDIKGMSAPKLCSLKICNHRGRRSKVKDSAGITTLFRDQMPSVRLRPTTLELDVSITTGALIIVLKNWPQIQHLVLEFNEFAWKGGFANGLLKKSNRLCPNLVSLKMDSRYYFDFEADDFASVANKMFQSRKGGGLELVQWRQNKGSWESLTRGDIA